MDEASFDNQENFSKLIGLIYDSAHNPELWPELLANLDEILKADQDSTAPVSKTTAVVAESSRIGLLRDHFKRALDLNKRLFQLKTERDAISSILDRLPIGVILVNAGQTPVAMNQHAKRVLQSGNALCVQGGKLIARIQNETKQMKDLIEVAAIHSISSDSAPNHSLQLTSKSGDPYSIWVAPSSSAGIKSEEGLAAIFIASSDIRQPVSVQTLASMYKLTIAEARLLEKLVNGSHSLNEAASQLNVSKHTVRSQMKTILEKTGTHSQVELLKKVLSGPAVLIGRQQQTEEITDLAALNRGMGEGDLRIMNTICLNDGRTMEYAEYGDPDGTPVFFLHSILHSRERLHPYSHYAESRGLRIIAPERPGFGYSDVQPEQSPAAYANDIRQLAGHLGIETFHLVGDASGAPFALGCAHELSDMIVRSAIISCLPNPELDSLEGLIPFERMLIHMGRTTPASFHRHFAQIMMKGMQKDPDKYYDKMFKHLPDADQVIVSTPEKRSIFMESIDNAFPSRVDGFVADYLFRLKHWDFEPSEIRGEVDLWHGTENRIVNMESARKLAEMIPNCRAHFLQGEGHYLFITHWDEILEELVKS